MANRIPLWRAITLLYLLTAGITCVSAFAEPVRYAGTKTIAVSTSSHHVHSGSKRARSGARWTLLFAATRIKLDTTGRVDLIPLQEQTITDSRVKVLSTDPLIYLVPSLLSDEECEKYQSYARKLEEDRPMMRSNPPAVSLETAKLWPLPLLSMGAGIPPALQLLQHDSSLSASDLVQAVLANISLALLASSLLAMGVLFMVRRLSESSSRTSEALALNFADDVEFIRPLVERIAAITRHAWYCWEAPVVTRYEPGAIFTRHGDASPAQGKEWRDLGGQRVVTCICYLNTVEDGGGETYFDQLGLSVAPVKGQGLFFFPADGVTWKADERTTHESLPPNQEKWIVQLFGRAQRVPSPLGIPDVFGK